MSVFFVCDDFLRILLGCPAGTDRKDPKFVNWVKFHLLIGTDLQPTYIGVSYNLLILKVPAGHPSTMVNQLIDFETIAARFAGM